LLASDAEDGAYFGGAVAISGASILIGARYGAGGGGSAYLYSFSAGSWVEDARFADAEGDFGYAVALDGDVALIGAPWAGKAFIYRHVAGAWQAEDELLEPAPSTSKRFANAVALRGQLALLGSMDWDSEEGFYIPRPVYLFQESAGQWSAVAALTDPDPQAPDFGRAVALSGSTAVVGAGPDTEDPSGPHAAYVFAQIGDCDANGVLDACEDLPDRDGDGVVDACESSSGLDGIVPCPALGFTAVLLTIAALALQIRRPSRRR
jgi:hypothetical protein